MSDFLRSIGVLNKIDFDIEEVGEPIPFRWGKCKLATASFGHGVTTTLLQLAKGYSIISNGGFDILMDSGIVYNNSSFRVFKDTGLAGVPPGVELLKVDNNGNLTVAGTISGSSITTTDIDGGSF